MLQRKGAAGERRGVHYFTEKYTDFGVDRHICSAICIIGANHRGRGGVWHCIRGPTPDIGIGQSITGHVFGSRSNRGNIVGISCEIDIRCKSRRCATTIDHLAGNRCSPLRQGKGRGIERQGVHRLSKKYTDFGVGGHICLAICIASERHSRFDNV